MNVPSSTRPSLHAWIGLHHFVAVLLAISIDGSRARSSSLPVTYYDFLGPGDSSTQGRVVHPDFTLQPRSTPTPGVIQPLLSGSVPGFQSTGGSPASRPQLTTPEHFASWFVPDPDYNLQIPAKLKRIILPSGMAQFHFPSNFFPLDGLGLGDYRDTGHNHHFTMTFSRSFVYDSAIQYRFDFASDDDLWVFINGRLWVDLGGIHPLGSSQVVKDLNEDAGWLGLSDGGVYTYQLFFAERHTGQSGLVATFPWYVPEAGTGTPVLLIVASGAFAVLRRRRTVPVR